MSYYLPQSPNNINVNLKVFIGSDNIFLPASVRLYQYDKNQRYRKSRPVANTTVLIIIC